MIRDAARDDLIAIADIYNQYISDTQTLDLEARTDAENQEWFDAHTDAYPIIVYENSGTIKGWACLSPWAKKPGYRFTAEITVYVDPVHQRQGIGRQLFDAIINRAGDIGYHSIMSRITQGNDVSCKIHDDLGFTLIGTMREVGYKLDRWFDVHIYQLLLEKETK